MKKTILTLTLLGVSFLHSENYIISVDKKHYDQNIIIDTFENDSSDNSDSGSGNQPISSTKSCLDILNSGNSTGDGVYTLSIDGSNYDVLCDMTTDGGGWTLITKFTPDDLSCNFHTLDACNESTLNNNSTVNSAALNFSAIQSLVSGSPYQELLSVGGGYLVQLRTTDKHFPIDVMDNLTSKTIECKNVGGNWQSYTRNNSIFSGSTARGLGTWFTGTGYIGQSGSKTCGNGVAFSAVATDRYAYQYPSAGYVAYSNTAGVFYIR